MGFGLLILRLMVGALFIGHGTQKLFGWFGGSGIDGTAAFMGSVGYRDGRRAALVLGLTETVSGALLVLGFLTPLAVAAIVGVMLSAMLTVHWRNGLWNTNNGIELPLVYAVAVSVLGFTGPGRISLDGALDFGLHGPEVGIVALGIGVGAALLALALRRPEPTEEEVTPSERVAA
jgi:putative oxidoreductase